MADNITIKGMTFDCDWRIDEYDNGESCFVLEGVRVNGQDITDIISDEWWEIIEQSLSNKLKGR